jgi:D-alanyl-D-alanine carboxypeptidase
MPTVHKHITRRQAIGLIAGGAAGVALLRMAARESRSGDAPALSSDAPARLQRILSDLARRSPAGHAVLVVESGDSSFRWAGALGVATSEGPAMTPGIPYHIASIDKLLTAATALLLHEAGRLDLDAPLVGTIPELVRGIHVLDGIDRSSTLTPRHLLTHTSGLADCFEDRPRGGQSMMERLFHEGDAAWSITDVMQLVREELEPHFPPQPLDGARAKIRYSDTNFQLLNSLIERLTGARLHTVFEDMVLTPLDMRSTWLPGRSARPPHLAAVAGIWLDDQPLDLPRALESFPSIYSTPADQIAFLRALVTGSLFAQPRTAELMRQPWRRFGFPTDAAGLRAPGWPVEYGMGMMRFRLPRMLSPRAAMPAVVGHTGSLGCWLFHSPERDLFLCGTVSQASAGAVPYRVVPKILSAMT